MSTTDLTKLPKNERLVKERIVNDLAEHVITVKHNDGLYRHWRCGTPESSNMSFHIITWPGSLCYTGDMGSYVFTRTEEMVAFMRTACHDYQYAAEKVVAGRDEIKEWSEELFRQNLADRIKDSDDGTFSVHTNRGREDRNVQEAVDEVIDDYEEYNDPSHAMSAMYESGLFDGGDLPSCKEYTFRFLWCLHAIKWFCEKVGEAKSESLCVPANKESSNA